MQRIDPFVFGNADDAHRVEVALIRGVAADTHHPIVLAEHIDRHRIHVGIGLHEYHLDPLLLRDANQLDRGAATRMNQHATGRVDQIVLATACRAHRGCRPTLIAELTGNHPGHHLADGILRKRYVRVDRLQLVVEFRQEWVFDEPLHRAWHPAQIVRQRCRRRQIRLHHDLARKRHAGATEVIRLRQRVGDEAGLGPARAITEAEHNDREIVVADEPGHPVVHRSHREQRTGPFLGLHAARGNEAHHGELTFGTFDQQFAELFSAGHIEGARLEIHVGYDHADLDSARPIVERAYSGDDPTGG